MIGAMVIIKIKPTHILRNKVERVMAKIRREAK